MINFRYHVVSLTAVFLALAIGLVVGTAALNGPAVDNLAGQVDTLRNKNQQFREQVDDLTAELNKQEQFVTEAAPEILKGKLAGRRVLVVSMPSASKYVDDVVKMLETAGAKVRGRLQLEDKLTDPVNNEQLLDLALNSAPPGVRGTLPARSNGVETSTALLAAVLVNDTPVEGVRTVISAYRSQGYLSITGDPEPAQGVVMLAAPPYAEQDAEKRNAAVLTAAERFGQAGKTVVAASGAAGDGNVVRAMRDDPDLAKAVSTVDDLGTAQGRLVTALALAEQFDGGVGHYGTGAGATSLLPSPEGARDGS